MQASLKKKYDKLPESNKRLLQLIDYKAKGSIYKFAQSIGLSHQLINRLFNIDKRSGKYPELSYKIIDAIANKFADVNLNWLITGKGPMLRDEPARTPEQEQIQTFTRPTDHPVPVQDIPLYDIRGSAGLSLLYSAQKAVPLETIRIPNLPKVDGAIFITGDSMYPVLKAGDIVVFRKINDIPAGILWGEIYILDLDLDGDQLVTVKYVQKSDRGSDWIKLVSQNEHHQDKDVPLSAVRTIAHVKASIRFHTMT